MHSNVKLNQILGEDFDGVFFTVACGFQCGLEVVTSQSNGPVHEGYLNIVVTLKQQEEYK